MALLSSLAVVFALGGGALGAYLGIAPGVPESVDLKSYQPKSASVFYTKDGSVLGWFYNERRFPVALDAVPKHVKEAIIAAEDTRFFSHSGIDPRGMVRAAIKNFRTGTFAQGGSDHYSTGGSKRSIDAREKDLTQISGNVTGSENRAFQLQSSDLGDVP